LTTAPITTLTAATGEVLTDFVGFRPVNLGHTETYRRVRTASTEPHLPCVGNVLHQGRPAGADLDGDRVEADR
jgi:hypothetical protein